MSSAFKKTLLITSMLLFISSVVLITDSCTPTYSRAEFEASVAETTRDTLGAVYYKGRKEGYDYFETRKNLGGDQFRLPISDSPISRPFDYSIFRGNWRLENFMHLKGIDLQKAVSEKFNHPTTEPKTNH